MEKLNEITAHILEERFGKDSIISLATAIDNIPYVRNVDGYYYDGSFYVITYNTSRKMKQIAVNSKIAIAGEWFTATGNGINLGYIYNEENMWIAEKLKKAFALWYDNGHNNYEDKNTIILQIKLDNGVLFANNKCFKIDFN